MKWQVPEAAAGPQADKGTIKVSIRRGDHALGPVKETAKTDVEERGRDPNPGHQITGTITTTGIGTGIGRKGS